MVRGGAPLRSCKGGPDSSGKAGGGAPQDWKDLAGALAGRPARTLKKLSLRDCGLDGPRAAALEKFLSAAGALEELDLMGNRGLEPQDPGRSRTPLAPGPP